MPFLLVILGIRKKLKELSGESVRQFLQDGILPAGLLRFTPNMQQRRVLSLSEIYKNIWTGLFDTFVRRTAGKEIPDAEKGGQAPGRPGASPRFSAGKFSSAGRLKAGCG